MGDKKQPLINKFNQFINSELAMQISLNLFVIVFGMIDICYHITHNCIIFIVLGELVNNYYLKSTLFN